MKRTLIAAAAIFALGGLTACGDNVEQPRTTTDPGAYSGGTGATGSRGANPDSSAVPPGSSDMGSGSMSSPSAPAAGSGAESGGTTTP